MTKIRIGISLTSIPKSSDIYFDIVDSIKEYQYYLYKKPDGNILVLLGDKITKEGIVEALICAYSQVTMGWDDQRYTQVKDWNIVECLKEKGWDIVHLDIRLGSYRIKTSLLK